MAHLERWAENEAEDLQGALSNGGDLSRTAQRSFFVLGVRRVCGKSQLFPQETSPDEVAWPIFFLVLFLVLAIEVFRASIYSWFSRKTKPNQAVEPTPPSRGGSL